MSAPALTAIHVTRAVYDAYKSTIAKHPPETFAILGGRLDDYVVTDFRFCPPARDSRGRFDASAAHINIDPDMLNWIVDREWKPNGKYMLGVWHSHPGSSTRPSVGDPRSNQGDVAFFSACLANDDSPERNWHTFIAPISTFAADGRDVIHGWTLRRGETEPRSCPLVIHEPASEQSLSPAQAQARGALVDAGLRVSLVRELLQHYAREISAITGDATLSAGMRTDMVNALIQMRDSEMRNLIGGRHPLTSILLSIPETPHA